MTNGRYAPGSVTKDILGNPKVLSISQIRAIGVCGVGFGWKILIAEGFSKLIYHPFTKN